MTPVPVTSFYAAVLALVFVVLTVRVIARRRVCGITLGTADDPMLERVARVHANFAEFVPLALLLLLLSELSGYPAWSLHVAGTVLLLGRLVHAAGVSRSNEDFRLRTAGVGATVGVLVSLSAALMVRLLLNFG